GRAVGRSDIDGGCVVRRVVITAVLLALACGGVSPQTDVRSTGPTSFRGISATFSLLDAFEVGGTGALGDATPVTVLEVGISDFPRSCAGTDAGIPGGRHGWLGVSIQKSKPDAIGPGTYRLSEDLSSTSLFVSASYFPYEASCDGFPLPGMTGQLRLAH